MPRRKSAHLGSRVLKSGNHTAGTLARIGVVDESCAGIARRGRIRRLQFLDWRQRAQRLVAGNDRLQPCAEISDSNAETGNYRYGPAPPLNSSSSKE